MMTLNHAIWAFNLLLQLAVVALLFQRRIAPQLPTFTTLLIFYLARSLALLALVGHIDAEAYHLAFNLLSIADVLLQVAVIWELYRAIPSASSSLRRLALFMLPCLLAAAASWVIARLVPGNPHGTIDRSILFTSLLTLIVAIQSLRRPPPQPAQTVLIGLAVVGTINIVTQIEQILAAVHRDASTFRTWSYINALAWILLLLYWLVRFSMLQPTPELATEQSRLPS